MAAYSLSLLFSPRWPARHRGSQQSSSVQLQLVEQNGGERGGGE